MKRLISTDDLELIGLIEKTGSLTNAAAAVFKVPSAISYSIKKLEEALGIKLFIKKGRNLVMTPACRVLLEEGRHLLDGLNNLEKMVIETDSGWEPKFNIAIDTILSLDFIHPYLKKFENVRTQIEISLYEEVLSGVWNALLQDKVQLIIGASGVPIESKIISHARLQTIEWKFATPLDHPLTKIKKPLTISDMEKYRFVVIRDPETSARIFSRKPPLRVPTMHDKINAIRNGLGVGFLPDFRIQSLLNEKTISTLSLEKPVEKTDLYLAWKTANKGKVLAWFLSELNKIKNP